jgi:hypothetical protein
MIPAILGLVALGGVLIVANWDEVVDWLRDIVPKFKAAWARLRPHLPYEVQILGDLVEKGADALMSVIHKIYYREENGKWMEQTTIREVNESEVPPHIREKILKKSRQGEQANITEEMELEMAS